MTWAACREADEELGDTTTVVDQHHDPSAIALTLSRRLVSRGKQKALMNMSSGLDMLALGLTISREVHIFHLLSVIPCLFFGQEQLGLSL